MKKFMSMLALIALLATSNANAENDGFFIGGSLLISGIQKTKSKHKLYSRSYVDKNINLHLYSFVFGYMHNLGDKFGLRYYGVIDANNFFAVNYNANVDVLYTLTQSESAELRAFAGAWLGYVDFEFGDDYGRENNEGLDLGVNAGVRAVFGQKHGVDFYARFGFLTQSKEYDNMIKWEVSQPYLIGVRYTYTF